MKKRFDEIMERSGRFARRIWDNCSWETVAISLFFSIMLTLFLLDYLLTKVLVPSVPAQMLGCLAYLWDIPISNRLWSVGCCICVTPLLFFGGLFAFSLLGKELRENMVRFGALSLASKRLYQNRLQASRMPWLRSQHWDRRHGSLMRRKTPHSVPIRSIYPARRRLRR